MEKIVASIFGLLLAGVFGLLSASSFLGWTHGQNSNRVIGMLTDLQQFLVGMVGGPITGVLFALAAVGILWAAFAHKPEPKTD